MAAKIGAAAATPASAKEQSRFTRPPLHTTLSAATPALEDGTALGRMRKDAELGCRALLRAQLKTGAHWIRDRETFAAACASVGLAA